MGRVIEPGETRYVCAVCGDPDTLTADDYVGVMVWLPDTETRQMLGAHATCLNKSFKYAPIEIVDSAAPRPSP
jgi:hypothetical protein